MMSSCCVVGHDFIRFIRNLSKEIGWYGKFIGGIQ